MSLKLLWTDIGVQYRGKGIITAWSEEMERRGWEIVRERERWRECALALFGSDSQLFAEPLGEIPSLLYFWGWMPARMLDRGWQEIATRQLQMMARCTRILVPSLVTMDQAACFGLPSHLCLPGVDSRTLDLGEVVEREPQVMFISRLAPHKHLDALIQAVSLITPRPGLLVVGPGDAGPFRRLAEELDVPAHFAELTDAEKATELRRSAVLVHPSSYEGFGLPAIEALYCGTPAIAFDIPQSRWLLQEDADFFTSVEGLAEAIVRIMERPEEARMKAARGQERVRKSLTLGHACERLEPHIYGTAKEFWSLYAKRGPSEYVEALNADHRLNWAFRGIQQLSPEWFRHWRLQHVLKELVGPRVLDVGAGAGTYSIKFALDGYDVTWLDISQEAYQQAQVLTERFGVKERINFLVADASAIPAPDESYDSVWAGEIFEHVPQPEKVLAESLRVLRPGGRFIFTTPIGFHHHDDFHLRQYTLADFKQQYLMSLPPGVKIEKLEEIAEEGASPSCVFGVLRKNAPGEQRKTPS